MLLVELEITEAGMTVNYYEWCSHSSCENRALLFQSFRESTPLVTLNGERSLSAPPYHFSYNITYAQKVSAFERRLFDGFLSEFEGIYQQLTVGRIKRVPDFRVSFLEKMMTHLPEDCGSWQSSGNREGEAYLSMRLSLKKTSRIMLLFRVFRDVLRDAQAVLPTRIYAHIPHADSGYYVCLSFRKFGGYLSRSFGKAYLPEQLEGEVARSATAKVISFILSGVMGSNTGDIVVVKGENISVRGYVGYRGRGPDNRLTFSGYSKGSEPFRVFPEVFVKGESLILTVFSGFALQGIPHSNKFRLAL